MKKTILATLFLALFGWFGAVGAQAAVIYTVLGTTVGGIAVDKLFFAQNVNVDGVLYDVSFVKGSCITLFSGCDEASDFDFTTKTDAGIAAQALLDQVFIDVAAGMFDTDPELTRGCNFVFECSVFIPYSLIPADINTVLWRSAQNHSTESKDIVSEGNLDPNTDFGGEPGDAGVYARFALTVVLPVPVPEPSTLALFGIGLAGLGFMTRRRKRRQPIQAALVLGGGRDV